VRELRASKNQRFAEIDEAVEGNKADMLSRFQNLQVQMAQVVADKNARFEKLEATVESESIDRKGMFQAINKRLTQEAQQWRVRAETSDREMKDHKRQAEIYGSNSRQRIEELREEVERIAAILRDNSMARDPFRHFTAKPALPAFGGSATIRPISRVGSPLQTERSMLQTERSMNRTCLGCTNCDLPYQTDVNLPGMPS